MGKREDNKKKIKKVIIIFAALIALAAVIVAIAVVPTAIIENRFENIFDIAEDMLNPKILVTDMGAENNFSDTTGEMLVDGAAALFVVEQISDVADDFKYKGRENAAGSFDIRYKIYEGEKALEIYLTKDGIYYINGDKKYVFVPEDSEAKAEYNQVYITACAFVK